MPLARVALLVGLNHRYVRRAVYALYGLALLLGIDAFFIEPARLVVHREELDLPNWPSELAGLRVVLLSDLHVGSPHWHLDHLRELVARANAEHPDLIVLAGDYTNNGMGEQVPIEPSAIELGKLSAPLGVVAALGNHDWWNGGPRTRAALEAHGLRVLDDEALRVDARGTSFCVLGLRDEYERQRSPRAELDLALPGLPLLVVVHEPDIFADLDARPSLVMAGHTHGGQVNLPLLGRRMVPSRYGERYAAGHIVENGRHLFVTTGVGTSILPVRFRVPPEIAVLTLR